MYYLKIILILEKIFTEIRNIEIGLFNLSYCKIFIYK